MLTKDIESKIEQMNIKQLVKYIQKTYHKPLRSDLLKIEEPLSYIIENYTE